MGKSTVTTNLARALAADPTKQVSILKHYFAYSSIVFTDIKPAAQVAILDVDICGPSQPRMLGVEDEEVHDSASGWTPVSVRENLMLMSIAFLLG